MRRVVTALLGMAAGFATLVYWLDLDRSGSVRAAFGVFAGVLALGLPLLFWCCKRNRWELWRHTLFATLGGGLCALPFSAGPYGFGFLLAIFLAAGALFGLLFWLAGVWRNEDLTCPKSFCLPCGTAYKYARHALRHR
jgi:hypothetical protein